MSPYGGSGAGMALVFVGTGVLGVLVGIVGFVVRTVRDVDTELPDHDADLATPVLAEALPPAAHPVLPHVLSLR